MHATIRTARAAGALYLLMSLAGFFSIIGVSRTLIVSGNATATATADKILASEALFRLGIVSELVSATLFIFTAVALFRLLGGVNKTLAWLMVALLVVAVPISYLNVVNELVALALLHGADYLSVFPREQLNAQAMLFLELHRQGIVVASIFWGLWLFPFGLLVMRSGFIPRILGILLIAVCFAYLANSLTLLLLPSYGQVVGQAALILEAAGETAIIAWLLIKGARAQPVAAPTS
jgi:Domain of unknown function (DUF4386)